LIYQFDQYEVDDREFRFSACGRPVPLEPKSLRLLVYLLENRNRLVRKQELLDKVWPEAMVTENALTRSIGLLRKALNDDSREPKFIETVPTAGYRFIAEVDVTDATIPQPKSEPRSRGVSRQTPVWMAVGALVAIAAAYLFFFHRPQKILTERDTVVLADFTNSTGDPIFDGTLRQGIEVQLEQSPFLSLIPDDRIQQVKKMMGQPADARLTPAIAREICERTSSTAVLDGSIAPLGSQYVLGLRATDCHSGKVLAEEQVQAARKEDVLHALDQISSKFRSQVGESLATIEKYDTPLAEATTPSLEALKAYSLGLKTLFEGRSTAALPFFQQAVELDPNFAEAYEFMATVYGSHHQPERAAENIRKAYDLRQKVSERERLSIEISYYTNATGEMEKGAQAMESLQQTYPRDLGSHFGLDALYRRLGKREKALEQATALLHLVPNAAGIYQSLGADYVSLNRLDEAEAAYKMADERKLYPEGFAKSRYLLAFLKGDEARMAQLAVSAMDKRGDEDVMLAAQADTAAWYGKLKDARELTRKAMDSAVQNDAEETAAGYQALLALFEVDSGSREQGLADAAAAMKLAPNSETKRMAALTLARAGDTAAAEKLAGELDKAFPLDTRMQRYWLPAIRAAVAMQRKDPGRAVEMLKVAEPIELGEAMMLAPHLRGNAYLMLHDGNLAAAEFHKFIDYRGAVRNFPWGPLGRLGLARAYAMQSDATKAKAEYQDFLTIWEDADPDIPILQQAKAEYAKLQ
jgi:DNA-binding winged helix-turn-helix (wHTH) protein/Flp pilus assembly protein TadD